MAKQAVIMKVVQGAIVPVDEYNRGILRSRGYHSGDILKAQLSKPRNPRFHRLVHAFGAMVADNIEAFTGMDAHSVLKRIQVESGIACDELHLNMPGIGPVQYRLPKSLSYESMDDGEFRLTFMGFCRHVSDRYWQDLTPEQIAEMAEVMPEAA